MKAGLFPMHVWLPEAHPAAPSHVSALMSGVMIKTGVYGVLRTAMYLPAGETLATAGALQFLLGAGIVTGLWGVLLAAMQEPHQAAARLLLASKTSGSSSSPSA